MKKFLVVIILIFALTFPVSAEGLYGEFYEASGMNEVYENTPEAATDFFKEYELDPTSPNFASDLGGKNLFSILFSYLKNGADLIIGSVCANFAIILLWALYSCFAENKKYGIDTAFIVVLILNMCAPIISLITATGAAIKSGGMFMLSFLPVFFGVTAASGAAQTAATSGMTLLLACEVTVQIIAFAVIPVASAQLALAVSGTLSDTSPANKLAISLKKASTYLLTLTFTIFLGLLSVQTTIGAAADTLSLKTTKFVVGSFIPVAGTALSETISTLHSSIKILQNGIGVYGIVVTLITVLPTVAALLSWKLALFLSKTAADMFGLPIAAKLVSSVDDTISMLLGVLLFVSALFIISLSLVLKVGGI